MNKSTGAPSGHGIVRTLIAIAVIGVVATVSLLTYQHATTSAATGQQTYASSIGGFSFTYPSDWKVTEGQAGVDDEILIAPSSASTSSTNQFLVTLIVAGNPDVSDPPAAMANGVVQKLTNGINLWISTSTSATKPAASAGRTVCPEMEITNAGQSHLSYALPNGQNLALIAGYCQGQNSTTSLTYQQQLANQYWQTAVSIIKSIQFN